MFEKRPKLSYFILGLFFGALCGGILVYYNSVITNENKISVNLIPQIVKQVIGVINTKNEQKKDSTFLAEKNTDNKQPGNDDKTAHQDDTYEEEENDFYDTDSLASDSGNSIQIDEQITIKKEELLSTKEIMIQLLDQNTSTKPNKNDSLLAVVSGTKDESKKNNQQKILVELWKSPINYKGYQASRNKIIFFGFSEIDEIKLYSLKNNLMVKYNDYVYTLEISSDFNNYEKVTDSNVLALINKINP
jgi:hypothetical protein